MDPGKQNVIHRKGGNENPLFLETTALTIKKDEKKLFYFEQITITPKVKVSCN